MAFSYSGAMGYTGNPRAEVLKAFNYLKKSDLAKDILKGLEEASELITIRVGTGLDDIFIHPEANAGGAKTNGGLVQWDPEATLDVIDKAKARPNVPWVKQHTKGIFKKTAVDKAGTISAAVALMHELGHCHQYLSDKEGYLAEMKKNKYLRCLEDTNCAAIENTVCVELNAAGCKEGIRWDYYHVK